MFIEGEIPNVVTTTGSNANGGFGNWGDSWLGIILLALVFGWGRNGNGFGGYGGGSGVGENYVLATDFATIERKLDGVNNGLCDGFYAQNTNMLNGFASVQQTLCQGFSGVNSAITNSAYQNQIAINGLSSQLANCCCGIEKSLLENRYVDAQNTCAITNAINSTTRDIIDNQNANYRAIHDEIVANRIEDKNTQISELKTALNNANLMASQAQQSAYLVKELSPKCPVPAFLTCNPFTGQTYTNGCGYGVSGCGASVV